MWSSALSTRASGQGSPYFSSRSFSRLPAFTPMRIAQPLARAAEITSLTRTSEPMLPGLMQASGAGIGRFQCALVVEMDVRDDRDVSRPDDLLQRRRTVLVGTGNSDDVDAGFLAAADLVDRRGRV